MRLLDANILVYAHITTFPQHKTARKWLDESLNGAAPVGLPWPTILGFIRLVTNPRIFEHPESTDKAWQQVESWLSCAPAWIPVPTERHREALSPLLALPGIKANLIPTPTSPHWPSSMA